MECFILRISRGVPLKAIDRMLLNESNEETKKILRRIKHANNDGFRQMRGEYRQFGPKYWRLQKTSIWRDGKQLNIQYRISQDKLDCPLCGYKLNFTRCTLHHILPYDTLELFTPSKVQITHNSCHQDFHEK